MNLTSNYSQTSQNYIICLFCTYSGFLISTGNICLADSKAVEEINSEEINLIGLIDID